MKTPFNHLVGGGGGLPGGGGGGVKFAGGVEIFGPEPLFTG